MPATSKCPECGTELPNQVPASLCPKCLLKTGLGSQPEPGAEATVVASAPPARPGALPRPGESFGHYRIVRELGKGGMGAVFEAEDTDSGRRVALKVLGHSFDSPDARKRFLREGRLAASINHPNSVYVYGTEEIEGAPAIAMELVTGGTLQDQVGRSGPMSLAEAVDTILQIITGLEAAQSIGILHRDIKPANCFVDTYGTVKIGDFGLSISTAARAETNLTVSGAFLGTPAFSSPEQLRGEELSVRSDIYAVGVTLFYLLTGRTPFQAENMVHLLATVLEQPAPSPARFRPAIPKGLGKVVLRCLEKQPAERFKNYVELRQALLPFNSIAPTPATLGLRFAAGVIDLCLLSACLMPLQLLLIGEPSSAAAPGHKVASLAGVLVWILYYAVAEGLWGATLGKAICRLRVVGPDRHLPGIPKALLRAALYQMVPMAPAWIFLGFDQMAAAFGQKGFFDWAILFAYYPLLALMFSTARRRNGYAGVHDLLSKTRVIHRSSFAARPAIEAVEPNPPASNAAHSIGPYHVLESLSLAPGQELLLSYDTRLLRKVWIRKQPPGSPPIPPHLRNLGRAGRLRWLNSTRSENECWDAYEGVSGRPLLKLLNERQSWGCVRFWLLDLAEELAAALKDQSMTEVLGLDRVWITADGRAKLLDFSAPGVEQSSGIASGAPPEAAEARAAVFLNQVAVSLLEGRLVTAGEARQRSVNVPLPMHARGWLEKLALLPSPGSLVVDLKSLLAKVAVVSRPRRLGLIAGCAFFPILALFFMQTGMWMVEGWKKKSPNVELLSHCLLSLEFQAKGNPDHAGNQTREREALEIYISGQFRGTITNAAVWNGLYAKSVIPAHQRERAEKIVASRPAPNEEELKQADAIVKPILAKIKEGRAGPALASFPLMAGAGSMYFYVIIPALIAALAFRGGLLLRAFGVVVVRMDGTRASRGRIFWRGLITWSPFLFAPFLMALLVPILGLGWALAIVLGVVLALVAWSAALPERGLQDRLAGTCLVPR